MSILDDVTAQLTDELDRALAGPVGALLGLDLKELVRRRVKERAPMLAAQLCQEDDDRLAAETVLDVMLALWPQGDPEPSWWRTPLGRMVARSVAHESTDAVTHAVAAAMLGVQRGTVGTMVHRGYLDRHPDGGVTRASVLARLARLEDSR